MLISDGCYPPHTLPNLPYPLHYYRRHENMRFRGKGIIGALLFTLTCLTNLLFLTTMSLPSTSSRPELLASQSPQLTSSSLAWCQILKGFETIWWVLPQNMVKINWITIIFSHTTITATWPDVASLHSHHHKNLPIPFFHKTGHQFIDR